MFDKYKNYIIIALAAVAFFWPQLKEVDWKSYMPKAGKSTTEVVVINFEHVDEPNDEFKKFVEGKLKLDGEFADRDSKIFAQYYSQLSKIVKISKKIQTTGDFREYHRESMKLNMEGFYVKGTYPHLGKDIASVLDATLSKKSVELDEALRNRLSKTLAAISWQLYHIEKEIVN